jgi:hypothetical protein
MKKFKQSHLIFSNEFIFFENKVPLWLTSKTYKWWWKDFVLELEIGKYIDSDFNRITRIK